MTVQNSESVTIGSYLMRYDTDSSSWGMLCKIKNYPDMGGEPNTVEITDLSDRYQRFLKGVQTNENKSFLANYVPDVYEEILAYSAADEASPAQYALWFGDIWDASKDEWVPTGTYGKFPFYGQVSAYLNGGEVDSPREMTIILTPSSKIDSVLDVSPELVIVTLDKYAIDPSDTGTITASPVYSVAPASSPDLAYEWQIRAKNGTSWNPLTSAYTGYNTATLTIKAADAEKHYRCKVTASGAATGTVYSNECNVNASA